jgi:predicted small secreted protein
MADEQSGSARHPHLATRELATAADTQSGAPGHRAWRDYEEIAMKVILLAWVGFSALSLSACNTIEGVGKDVKATGKAVESAAKSAKPK